MCMCVYLCAHVCTLPHWREIRDMLSFQGFIAPIHLDHCTSSQIKRNRKETIFDNPLTSNVQSMANNKPFAEEENEKNVVFL